MGTTENLKAIKTYIATAFLNATDRSAIHGLQLGYSSYPSVDISYNKAKEPVKGWVIDIKVKEAGYGERNIQQFLFQWPNNIDAKNMELHALQELLTQLVLGAVTTWYEVAKMLASDKELQKNIINETKENNISSH